ncbi:hypothetical protein SBA6_180016 [Candidatus Sulfopaludibacter sp. SbA6]|nr:hypothetical protein SBA6_180016 [Candidatus Sulfopaludibacter sp. SbA6]
MRISLQIRPGNNADVVRNIAAMGWNWGIAQTGLGQGRAGGGASTVRTDITNIAITKFVDESSPALFRYCATGEDLPEVTLDVEEEADHRLQIRMTNVIIASIQVAGTEGGRSTEQLSLRFERVELEYQSAASDRARVEAVPVFAWSLAQNASIDAPPRLPAVQQRGPSTGMTRPGGTGSSRVEPPGGTSPDVKELAAARVRFTVYHPSDLTPETWHRLLAYIHTEASDADVEADSLQRLGRMDHHRKARGAATVPLLRGTEITVIPELPGCVFNPRSLNLLLLEDLHCAEFRVQLAAGRPGFELERPLTGQVSFFAESVLIGEVPIWVVGSAEADGGRSADSMRKSSRAGYESVFVSYSHVDESIVARVGRAYKALGMQFLRDIEVLRSGEEWNGRLLELIEQADIFQLYWSDAARDSTYVEREWRHALNQARKNFIRPVYWMRPMPPPPAELNHFNFAFLPDL